NETITCLWRSGIFETFAGIPSRMGVMYCPDPAACLAACPFKKLFPGVIRFPRLHVQSSDDLPAVPCLEGELSIAVKLNQEAEGNMTNMNKVLIADAAIAGLLAGT